MGILNITPDSYYDGGKFNNIDSAILQGIKMFNEGADIIDIGAESTKPGAIPVSEKEELERILPVIRALKKEIPLPLSIDTLKPRVAEAALNEGISMLNDITGFSNPDMITLAVESQVPICVMHMQGTPKTMQNNPFYKEGVVPHLIDWFLNRTMQLLQTGIKKENIIIDPGIGFGKTVEDNLKILHNLQKFKSLNFSVLVGLSRKSFMSRILNKTAVEILPATLAMNSIAVLKKTDIIRVHDVLEHRQVVDVLNSYNVITE